MEAQLTADEAAIHATVGDRTFGLGRDYAGSGAVQNVKVSEGGRVASGRVLGSARTPYSATAAVRRDAAGSIVAFVGTCTCPVRAYCKHSVAVALSAFVPDSVRSVPQPAVDPAPVSELAGWEETLRALTRAARTDTPEPRTDIRSGVALQFEVHAGNAYEPPSVVLRPVVPGRTGWVRSGIGWANLDSLRYSGRRGQAGHVRLLGELLALHSGGRSGDGYGYGDVVYREHRMTLELFRSRRVWDLLLEMQATGLPLVQAGRGDHPVAVHESPAGVGFDLTRGEAGVTITPRLLLDGRPLTARDPWLLGSPAHGAAWLDGEVLQLAPLAASPDVDVAAVLATAALTVPEQAQERLLADYVPRLRRLAIVLSSDASVVLPEPTPPALALRAEYGDGHRVRLAWSWVHSDGAARRVEPLAADSLRRAPVADAASMRRLLAQVLDAVRVTPALLDDDGALATERMLSGLATVTFTEQVLPALDALDGVEVTVGGEPADYREITEAPVITFEGEPEGRDWYDLTMSVSVDGEQVPFLALFEALARGEEHLILPSGVWFALDRPEFTQLAWLIEESRALLDAPAGTVRVGRLQAGVWDELDRLGIVDGQADAWRGAARALSTIERIPEQPVPSGLQAELRSYQFDGFTWLAFLFEHGLGGVLADEMGLGKTVQTLALMCHVQEKGLADTPFLVVAPTSVVHNWASEAARFAPGLTVRTVTGTQRRRGRGLAEVVEGADLVITSYTLFRLEHDAYTRLPWAGLVLDEAQFAKNHESQAYRCAKALDVAFKLAVTGTPLENTMMELWSLLSITAPGLFPKPAAFETYYRRPIEREHDAGRLEQLRSRIRPLMLRRTKAQVLDDLPDKQEQVLELDLNPRHRRVYQTYLQRERQKVLGLLGDLEKNRFAIFRSLTLLRQACLDAALVDPVHAGVPSTKLDALLDQLTELASEGHRAVVFSQFTRFLDAARARLEAAGIDYCYLDGKTTRRAEVIDRFKNGTAPVFLISLKAGGFGLTLTEADYCFLLDPWWNPATEAQAVDRLHRIGQPRKVMVYRMVARETIEEKVMALKAGKAAIFDAVMDAGGVTSAALTAADIRGLLE